MKTQVSIPTKTGKLKAYVVFPGTDPCDMGCSLVYAYKASHARLMGVYDCPWEVDYIEMRARRRPDFDKWAIGDKPYIITDNSELPNGASPFYGNSEDCYNAN